MANATKTRYSGTAAKKFERYSFGEVHDVADNVLIAGWHGPDDINRYFRDCKRRGVGFVGWRLSQIGDFTHHSKIENSPLGGSRWSTPFASTTENLMQKYDFLELGVKYAKKHGVLLLPYLTMCDEGWFPRFKFLSDTVEKYYQSEGFKFLIRDDDYLLKPGFHSLHRWLADPDEVEKRRYEMMIPAVEQGQTIPKEEPWSCYTRFAREHPELASQTKAGFKIGRHLSYAYQAVRDYRISLLKEIAAYGCDGFILDYSRWCEDHDVPMHDEHGVSVTGYDKPTTAWFKEKYGRTTKDIDNSDPQWIKCRAEASHTLFLKELRQAFPDKTIIGKVPLNDPLKIGFMDVEDWAEKRLVDAVFIYECHRNYYDPLLATSGFPELRQRYHKSSPIEWADEWLKRINGKIPVLFYPWIRVYDEKDGSAGKCRYVTERELYEQALMQKKMGAGGTVLYENLNALYYHPLNLASKEKTFTEKQYAFDDSLITLKLYRKDQNRCALQVTFAEPHAFLPDENRFLPNLVTLIVDGSTVLRKNAGDYLNSVEVEFSPSLLVKSPHRIALEASSFGHRLEKVWEVDL